ncbi:hypothetical protein LSH36_3080g00001 [Paralvinella palmiformis]|uniref:Uncharacterized protein n=1 Tax=Paralvinella palmiformis TaxID=53620 RepID=A0AAD9IPN6_9ANNE|nr:hypothetical protein LSH36_3080g00001 [Paralvinella palmiformis]
MQRWQEITQWTISQRRQNQIATSHYGRTLVIKAWRVWHEAISVGIRKQLLMPQAMWMHNKRLTAQSFHKCV